MYLKRQTAKNTNGYLAILPAYSIYVLFVLIPALITVYFSFTNYDLFKQANFIGWANYTRLFHDELFLKALWNTTLYTLISLLPPIIIGLVIAAVLNQKMVGRSFFRTCFYLPYIPSMISMAMVWLWIYEPSQGVLNIIMKWFGLPPQNWLINPKLALGSVILMSVWKTIGYAMIIYLGGLQEIPGYIYEAAKIDGASPVKTFFRITIPLLKPVTFFLVVTGMINCFNVFDQVNIMTNGGPVDTTTTVVHQIYNRGFFTFEMGYASAMVVMLLVLVFTTTMLNFRLGNQGFDQETT